MGYEKLIEKIKEKIICGELEKKIGYFFKNKNLLLRAISHKSYTYYFKKNYQESNERLELLGDAVLSLVIIEILLEKFPSFHEGKISSLKAKIVSELALEIIAKELNLDEYILLGRGEYNLGQNKQSSILADTVESIIGAIYKDGGLDEAKKFIKKHFEKIIELCSENKEFLDYKTKLQEIIQKKYKTIPEYVLINEIGPEHDKTFFVKVKIKDKFYGKGSGKTKKEAEQNAAKEAIKKIDNSNISQS